HAAEAVDDISLSININFNYSGFFDLILPYLRETLASSPEWREPPPAAAAPPTGSLPPAIADFMSARVADLRHELDAVDPRFSLDPARIWHHATGAGAVVEREPSATRGADMKPETWLADRARAYRYEVTPVPLAELPRWHLGDDLAHDTRRF